MKRSYPNGETRIPCYNPVKKTEGLAMPFAAKLVKLRKEKRLTQEELAKKIRMGIAQVRRYEKGASSPTLEVIKNIARTLGVSADELIFDENEGVASAKIVDRELLEQFEELSRMEPRDQEAIKTVLESMIIKNRVERVMPAKRDVAWSKKMHRVVSELRKGAEKYTDEEIDEMVDEAVKAVRGERNRRRERARA